MTVLWEQLDHRNLPHYEGRGRVAWWYNNEFGRWDEASGGVLQLAWSPLADGDHWSPIIERLLEQPIDGCPDAIVAYAEVAGWLQIAVARTKLLPASPGGNPPSWYSRSSLNATLLHLLRDKFEWLEKAGLRVGSIYLSQADIRTLEDAPPMHFDRVDILELRRTGLRGSLWGAHVFESDLVPARHVAVLPDGFEGKLVDTAACVPLGR